ncbi:NTP transferase domain-containing protein [candidate division KSB1 bacterium]|nr:NTP transferase domain-containing protein [candidate division KSB1 bacterium]
MTGIIMAGGFGTRLKPLTCNIPKPMVPIANRPIMEHVVNLLRSHGINEIISLLHHQPEVITNYFGDGSRFKVNMRYIHADEDYGTAGAVRKAASMIDDRFVVISGDVLTDIDLTKAILEHQEKQGLATLILTRVQNPLAYGVVMTSDSGRITRFLEKPTWGQIFSDTINTGMYILEPNVFEYIPDRTVFDFSKDLFPKLLADQKNLLGHVAEGYWKDVGDLNEYQNANLDCLNGAIKVEIAGHQIQDHVWIGDNCKLESGVQFEGAAIVGHNTTIKKGTRITNSIIGNNCSIEEESVLYDSILWDDVIAGKDVHLNRDTVAKGSRLADQVFVLENVFISENCSVGKNARIKSNIKVWPDKIIDDASVVTSSVIWGDRWYHDIFANNRITGIVNSEVSPEFVAKLAGAYGAYLGMGSSVLCGRDPSEASEMVTNALKSGFMAAGLNVRDLQVVPIPVGRYQLRSGPERGGTYVRKSPFDPKLIDILFFDDDGRDLPTSKTKSIERMFFREDFRRASFNQVGHVHYPAHVKETYCEDLISHLDARAIEQAKYRVVIDYSFGAAALILPKILGVLDCEVISVNAFLDSRKLTKNKTAFDKQLQQLSKIVNSLQADIGFLVDTCAEKIFVVDEKGRFIDSDRLLAIITKLLVEANCPRKIAVPINASSLVDRIAIQHGVEIVRTRNDARMIVDAYFSKGVQYAGDTKGGFIFTEFLLAFDGMFTMAKILELMSRKSIHLGELNDMVPVLHMAKVNVPCPWEQKGKVMRRLMEYTEGKDRQLIDGVKVFDGTDWVLTLPDTERPFVHVNAEAEIPAKAQQMVDEYRQKILEWIDD